MENIMRYGGRWGICDWRYKGEYEEESIEYEKEIIEYVCPLANKWGTIYKGNAIGADRETHKNLGTK